MYFEKRKSIKTLEDKPKRKERKEKENQNHHDVATGWCKILVVDVVSGSVLIPIVCFVGDTIGDECRFIKLAMDGNGEFCCCWCWCCICELVPFVNRSTISYRISVMGVNAAVEGKLSLIEVNRLHGWSRWRCLAIL